jgi:hypothetical protein
MFWIRLFALLSSAYALSQDLPYLVFGGGLRLIAGLYFPALLPPLYRHAS